jgi:hypothetical protein
VAQAAPPESKGAAPHASEEDTQTCVAASTQGQTDRDEGRLLAAREQFLACTREACPSIVKKSCSTWLAELGERIPSVVVRIHDAGQHDVTDARVTLDGKPIALDGRPVALDPGTHALSVNAQGFLPVARTLLLAEREQGRLLVVELPARTVPPARSAALESKRAPATPKRREPAPPASFHVPVAGWVLGGLGVVGVATFVALRSKAQSDLHELERDCSPYCSDRQRDAGKRKTLAADISLGVGIAALAGACAWTLGSWLRQRHNAAAEPRAALALVPTRGGAVAALAARY